MTPEAARLLLQFLTRIDLKGGEVPVFNRVIREVEDDANAQVRPMNGEDHAGTAVETSRD